ncbi:hypothetical protein Adt_03271 [Abeliophyllum distichum]|uniref:CheW-like domain-containing protein n=1 Tax=Abeliophyllum distichum TaxID=126358 RepID=A0ABD1VY18_9LAMI
MSTNFGSNVISEYPVEVVEVSSREVSPKLAEVLPIRGIATCMGEKMTIIPAFGGGWPVGVVQCKDEALFGLVLLAGPQSIRMPLNVFEIVYLQKMILKKMDKEEDVGWYYFAPRELTSLRPGLPFVNKAVEGDLILGVWQLTDRWLTTQIRS